MTNTVSTSALAASDVSVMFGGFTALSDVTLAITPGAVHGLIGPNGAGKTALVNVLTGFQEATIGQMTLDGASIGGIVKLLTIV